MGTDSENEKIGSKFFLQKKKYCNENKLHSHRRKIVFQNYDLLISNVKRKLQLFHPSRQNED